jgi:hypothetical protein
MTGDGAQLYLRKTDDPRMSACTTSKHFSFALTSFRPKRMIPEIVRSHAAEHRHNGIA